MKIQLGDYNEKVGIEDIFKSTNGNQSLHQSSNDNGVRIINLTNKRMKLLIMRCSLADS